MLFPIMYGFCLFSWAVGLNLGPGRCSQALCWTSTLALGLYSQHPLLSKLFNFRQGLVIVILVDCIIGTCLWMCVHCVRVRMHARVWLEAYYQESFYLFIYHFGF